MNLGQKAPVFAEQKPMTVKPKQLDQKVEAAPQQKPKTASHLIKSFAEDAQMKAYTEVERVSEAIEELDINPKKKKLRRLVELESDEESVLNPPKKKEGIA